jgi:hypothetical protein
MDGKLGPILRESHALRVFLEQVAGEDSVMRRFMICIHETLVWR